MHLMNFVPVNSISIHMCLTTCNFYLKALTMDVQPIPVSSGYDYEETLSIQVSPAKEGENATLKCFFGILMRSEQVIDTKHKYCNECLKKKKVVRLERSLLNEITN